MDRDLSSASGALDQAEARSWTDRYLLLLLGVLAGYAFMGKGFAYLGAPPVFVGEIALLLGTLVFFRIGLMFACLATLPSLILATMMAWTLVRTLPYVRAYGIDALRDSAIVIYGAFSYIVIALLLDDGRRLDQLVQRYARFLDFFVPAVPILFGVCQYMREWVPNVPGTQVPIVMLGAGEVPVHLAGAAVFAMVGFYRPTVLWIVSLIAAVLMASALNRGGMLAFVIPVCLAAVLSGKVRSLVKVVVVGLMIFGAAYAVEKTVTGDRGAEGQMQRQLQPSQFVENAQSIFGHSDSKLEGSRRWRLEWWALILDDTLHGGPHFWTGRGYGLNLAVEDGFGGGREANPLRSPHNAHMTLLARAGVPGLALWILFLVSWFGTMLGAFFDARRRRQKTWADLFLVVVCYALGCIINATFDVALEGPMQGIWFWCLIGVGIGAVMIFRFQHRQPFVQGARP
ncbi:MAG: O-antigen ligase family protein [Xanthobacteraceae bacterium]|nr:O-antigen ligase family protein [Xanthobacteraceae bacterium]